MARLTETRASRLPVDEHKRVLVEAVRPELNDGRYPVKRVVGDEMIVEVDLVSDGHDIVSGALQYRHESEDRYTEVELESLGNDTYRGSFELARLGRYLYTVEGWVNEWSTWRRGFEKKAAANQDLDIDLQIGAGLLEAAAARAKPDDARELAHAAHALATDELRQRKRVEAAVAPELTELACRYPNRDLATSYERELAIVVDRARARFSAWYEMFPRSCGKDGKHGTFRDAEARLPYVAELGFDILYLPPIHPIGITHRKGRNNSLTPETDDPGSPWAIGSELGGHTAVHPELGTLDDFRRFVKRAHEHDLEVALDIAFQASPDHPWVKEHPEWFTTRPDGTIQYAENPPKKYQDIYPLDFGSKDWRGLWQALHDVLAFWVEQGVRCFRVDNPHTKSLRFWGWCITELKREHPDLIFLAEAFTRPKLMYALAKLGFTQSYTYFTWRHSRHEFTEYLTELTRGEAKEFFRPNFWPNTPDILPPHLTHGGPPAFRQRLVLAATLSPSYGIYGPTFELMEHEPRPGVEEYIDNEKYELREWDLDRPDSLRWLIARINRMRRAHPALQRADLTFVPTDNDQLLAFEKWVDDDRLLVVINMDPHHKQAGWVELPLHDAHLAEDVLAGGRYFWHGDRHYVEIDPHVMPAHVFTLKPR